MKYAREHKFTIFIYPCRILLTISKFPTLDVQYSPFNIAGDFTALRSTDLYGSFPEPILYRGGLQIRPFCVLITAEGQFVCAPFCDCYLLSSGERYWAFVNIIGVPPGHVTTAFYSVFNHYDRRTLYT